MLPKAFWQFRQQDVGGSGTYKMEFVRGDIEFVRGDIESVRGDIESVRGELVEP